MTDADKQNVLILWLIAAGGILTIYWLPWVITRLRLDVGDWGSTPVVVGLLIIVLLAEFRRPPRQFVAALLLFGAVVWLPSAVKRGEAQRSYFGVYRVQSAEEGAYHTLIHGTTLHEWKDRGELHGSTENARPRAVALCSGPAGPSGAEPGRSHL